MKYFSAQFITAFWHTRVKVFSLLWSLFRIHLMFVINRNSLYRGLLYIKVPFHTFHCNFGWAEEYCFIILRTSFNWGLLNQGSTVIIVNKRFVICMDFSHVYDVMQNFTGSRILKQWLLHEWSSEVTFSIFLLNSSLCWHKDVVHLQTLIWLKMDLFLLRKSQKKEESRSE